MRTTPFIHIIIAVSFVFNLLGPLPEVYAQNLNLPKPGVMVHLSPEFTPAHLRGVTIHLNNALQFDFLIQRGDDVLSDEQKKEEYQKLVKYFLASLTIPDEDQWVNLSPYEKDRIIKDNFGKTEMGRDLLAQDYLLKQITSSLIYPEDNLGKKFWERVYERAWKEYGTTAIPVNTFNKVWIMPDQAVVYENGNTAYIIKSHLKVLLESDYLALKKSNKKVSVSQNQISNDSQRIGTRVVRQIILPELEKEVNEGKNFALLRQIYSSMILATWYKKTLKESLLGRIYADKAKVKGVNLSDPKDNEVIYQQYLKAFRTGVFNYIKEDVDKYTKETVPRKYFSGGFTRNNLSGPDGAMLIVRQLEKLPLENLADVVRGADDLDDAQVVLNVPKDNSMTVSMEGSMNFHFVYQVLKENHGNASRRLKEVFDRRAEWTKIEQKKRKEFFKEFNSPKSGALSREERIAFLKNQEEQWRKAKGDFGEMESVWLFEEYMRLGGFGQAISFYENSQNKGFKDSDGMKAEYVNALNRFGLEGILKGYVGSGRNDFLNEAIDKTDTFVNEAEKRIKNEIGEKADPSDVARNMYLDLYFGKAIAFKNKYILIRELKKEMAKSTDSLYLQWLKNLYGAYFSGESLDKETLDHQERIMATLALKEFENIFNIDPYSHKAGNNTVRMLLYRGDKADLERAYHLADMVRYAALKSNPKEFWVQATLLEMSLVRMEDNSEESSVEFRKRLVNLAENIQNDANSDSLLDHLNRWRDLKKERQEPQESIDRLTEVIALLEASMALKQGEKFPDAVKRLQPSKVLDLVNKELEERSKKLGTEERNQKKLQSIIEQSSINPGRFYDKSLFPGNDSKGGIVPAINRNAGDRRFMKMFLELKVNGKALKDAPDLDTFIDELSDKLNEAFGLVDSKGQRPLENLNSPEHQAFDLYAREILEALGVSVSGISASNLMALLIAGIGDCRVTNYIFASFINEYLRYQDLKELREDKDHLDHGRIDLFKEGITRHKRPPVEPVLMQTYIMEGNAKRESHTLTVLIQRDANGYITQVTLRDLWYQKMIKLGNKKIDINADKLREILKNGILVENGLEENSAVKDISLKFAPYSRFTFDREAVQSLDPTKLYLNGKSLEAPIEFYFSPEIREFRSVFHEYLLNRAKEDKPADKAMTTGLERDKVIEDLRRGFESVEIPRDQSRFVPKEITVLFDIADQLGLPIILTGGTARDFVVYSNPNVQRQGKFFKITDYDVFLPNSSKVDGDFNSEDYARLKNALETRLKEMGYEDNEMPHFPIDFTPGVRVEESYVFQNYLNSVGQGDAFGISRLAVQRKADGNYVVFGSHQAIEDMQDARINIWKSNGESLGYYMASKMMAKASVYNNVANFKLSSDSRRILAKEIENSSQSPQEVKYFMRNLYRLSQLQNESSQDSLKRLQGIIEDFQLEDRFGLQMDDLVQMATDDEFLNGQSQDPENAVNAVDPDSAMLTLLEKNNLEQPARKKDDLGGIDFNSANLDLQIKRDGKGIPLPFSRQDPSQLNSIEGFVPVILEIKPLSNPPIVSQLKDFAYRKKDV